MKLRYLSPLALLVASSLFLGCSDKDEAAVQIPNNIEQNKNEKAVSFSYALSGVHHQQVAAQSRAVSREVKTVIAKLIITDSEGNSETTDWSVLLDTDKATITSQMTYVVPAPGRYRFTLDIEKDGQRYFGTSEHLIDADQKDIPLAVKPVIGDLDIDFTVQNLPRLTFQYKSDDLLGLTTPKIGYRVDGGVEQTILLDKTTGKGDVYLNIAEGAHNIELSLYDGAVQVGKSRLQQESVNIVSGQNVLMDLIPLNAEVMVHVPVEGGAGTINITVPAEVIAETEGLENLNTIIKLQMAGGIFHEESVILTQSGESYVGSVTFDPLMFGPAIITVEFWDSRDLSKELLASVIFNDVILQKTNAPLTGLIDLLRRAIIGGDILAVVGVNVLDVNGNPVEGATISVNSVDMGLTGDALPAWGTKGYLKFYHKKGTAITLKAIKDGLVKDTTITLKPLETKNYTLRLKESDVGGSKFHLRLDNSEYPNYIDVYGHPITSVGNSITAQVEGSRDGAYFDGASHLSTPHSAAFDLSNNDFTIDGWFKTDGSGSGTQFIVNKAVPDVLASTSFWVATKHGAASRDVFEIGLNAGGSGYDGTGYPVIKTTVKVTDNKLHHFAVVRSGDDVLIYLDGIKVHTHTLPANFKIFNSPDTPLQVGAHSGNGYDHKYKGFADEIRINNGEALWTGPSFDHNAISK